MKRYKRGKRRSYRGPLGILAIIAGAVLCAFTAGNFIVGNQNLGVWLPLIAGAPLLFYGIFKEACDSWFATGFGRIAKWIVIAVYGIAVAVVGTASIFIASAAVKSPEPGADAIMVLGAAVHGDEVTDTLEKRLNKALDYYRENPSTLIVVSGGMGSNENVSEAEAMRRYLEAQGVPATDILMEDESTNTQENFENTKRLLDERFDREDYSIVYVTSDFHVYRAGQEAERAGLINAEGLAAPTPILTVPGAYMRESAALAAAALRALSGKV